MSVASDMTAGELAECLAYAKDLQARGEEILEALEALEAEVAYFQAHGIVNPRYHLPARTRLQNLRWHRDQRLVGRWHYARWSTRILIQAIPLVLGRNRFCPCGRYFWTRRGLNRHFAAEHRDAADTKGAA